jgi:hypothetical protein
MNIRYLKHEQIDIDKWDQAIDNCTNALVYAKAWYLNIVSPKWDALVMGDYKVVMPLTYRKKFGIKYLFKPFFSQFLGVFYKNEDDAKYVPEFLEEASKHFRLIDMNINVSNSNFKADFCKQRQTQVLFLSKEYEELRKNYNRSNRKNVNKANREYLRIEKSAKPDVFIQMTREMYKDRKVQGVSENDFKQLYEIARYSTSNGMGELHYAYMSNQICASAFFLDYGDRIILQTAINDDGKETGAIFKVLDQFIRSRAGTNQILDFAGSNIQGVAYRNLGFGSVNQHYFSVYINNLPWFIRLLRRN